MIEVTILMNPPLAALTCCGRFRFYLVSYTACHMMERMCSSNACEFNHACDPACPAHQHMFVRRISEATQRHTTTPLPPRSQRPQAATKRFACTFMAPVAIHGVEPIVMRAW